MSINPKRPTLLLLLALLAVACLFQLSAYYFEHRYHPPYAGERISDRFQRDAVSSYEVFDVDIVDHALVMVHLKTGELFPMVCRRTTGSIQTIPQSTFAETPTDRWTIMCEPQVRDAWILMQLKVSRAEGGLYLDGIALKLIAPKPLLL